MSSPGFYNNTGFDMNRGPMYSMMSPRSPGMMDYNFGGFMNNDRMTPMTNDLNYCCDDKQEEDICGTSMYDRYSPSRGNGGYGYGYRDDYSNKYF